MWCVSFLTALLWGAQQATQNCILKKTHFSLAKRLYKRWEASQTLFACGEQEFQANQKVLAKKEHPVIYGALGKRILASFNSKIFLIVYTWGNKLFYICGKSVFCQNLILGRFFSLLLEEGWVYHVSTLFTIN